MSGLRVAALETKDLSFSRYNDRTRQRLDVLLDVSLRIDPGELVAIVGPSGCGKTTFLELVVGLLSSTAGRVSVDGRTVTGPGPDRACVFQHASLLPWRTVARNVSYGLELQRAGSPDALAARASKCLDLVGLAGYASHYPHELSGGMQQRVNLARALVMEPVLLLLDEPFASLDAQTREAMQGELRRILAETKTTAVLVTHQVDEAVLLSNRIVVFSPRPARVVGSIPVELPPDRAPSLRRSPGFAAIEDQVLALLHDAAPEDVVHA